MPRGRTSFIGSVVIDIRTHTQQLVQGVTDINRRLETVGRAASRTRNLLVGALGIRVGTGLVSDLIEVERAFQRIENTLQLTTGTMEGAIRSFQFLEDESARLGLNLREAGIQFGQLSAAAKGTSLEGEETERIFTAISEAAIVLGLSSEETRGALFAIQQMISKNTVSAEELRGQLGERLPGAVQLAARAIGKTTQELQKMLEQGQLLATEFLPKFREEVTKTFGDQALLAAQGLTAQINRLATAWDKLLLAVGRSGVIDVLVARMTEVARIFDVLSGGTANRIEAIEGRWESLREEAGLLGTGLDGLRKELAKDVVTPEFIEAFKAGEEELRKLQERASDVRLVLLREELKTAQEEAERLAKETNEAVEGEKGLIGRFALVISSLIHGRETALAREAEFQEEQKERLLDALTDVGRLTREIAEHQARFEETPEAEIVKIDEKALKEARTAFDQLAKSLELQRMELLLTSEAFDDYKLRLRASEIGTEDLRNKAMGLVESFIELRNEMEPVVEFVKDMRGEIEQSRKPLDVLNEQLGLLTSAAEKGLLSTAEAGIALRVIWERHREAVMESRRDQDDLNRELEESAEGFRDMLDPSRSVVRQMEELEKVFGANRLEVEEYQAVLDILKRRLAEVRLSEFAREMRDSFASAFEDMIVDVTSFMDVLSNLEQQILRLVTRELVTKPFTDFLTGAIGGLAGSGGFLGTLFSPKRQIGGPVSPGVPVLVGETGPEFFLPPTAGTISPGAPEGMTVVNNIRVEAPGGVLARESLDQLQARIALSLDRSRARNL